MVDPTEPTTPSYDWRIYVSGEHIRANLFLGVPKTVG